MLNHDVLPLPAPCCPLAAEVPHNRIFFTNETHHLPPQPTVLQAPFSIMSTCPAKCFSYNPGSDSSAFALQMCTNPPVMLLQRAFIILSSAVVSVHKSLLSSRLLAC